jgi:hypothetical protein
MKKTTLLILITSLYFNANAAIFTVCNLPNSGAQYSQINPAIAAATNGDTIYVIGSNITYNNCTIDKNITLIGPGTYAQKEYVIPATVALISFSTGLNGVAVLGFNCSIKAASNIQNIEIGYNNLNAIGGTHPLDFFNAPSVSNLHIHSNIITGSVINICADFQGCTPLNNVIIENNIITKGAISTLNGNFVFLTNNVFYNSTYTGDNAFSSVSNAILNNNIFYNSDPLSGATSCSYNNNITYSSSTTFPALPVGNGNIDNTDPLMVNVSNTGAYLPTLNFALQAGSPALNAGNDGENMGITGGNNTSTVTGEVYNMPVIRKMMIQNTSVPQNGNIDVKVRSTKSRTN